MSYFSRLSVEQKDTQDEQVWASEEQKLLDRLEDLDSRLEDLRERGDFGKESWGLSDEDLRYVLPKDLKTIAEVNRAILIAESDIWKLLGINWGIFAGEVKAEPTEVKPFVIPGQMTIDDYLKGTEKVA